MNDDKKRHSMDADIDTSMMEINFDNDRPVQFSEAVFESQCDPEHCLLCISGNNDERGRSIIEELEKIDKRFIGKISDKAIFHLMAKWYEEKIRQPQLKFDNNADVPILTPETCRIHFTFHAMNPKRIVKEDILFINNAQEFLKTNGVLKQNMSSGNYSINNSYLKQYNILSKTKLDLLRYYKNEFSNELLHDDTSDKPHEFSSF